jgi:glutaredoxin
VQFELKDIREDPDALRELMEGLQSRATPTLVVGDKVIMGFDPEQYQAALAPGENKK